MNTHRPSLGLLAVISGLASFTLTMPLPALPALAGKFSTGFAEIQLLVSAFLFGLAVSQPLWGHMSDTLGRRPVLLAGIALYIVASLACLLDPGLYVLASLRALQAVGASAGSVVARAIIRDTYAHEDAARAMSWISIGLGTAPIIAPIIGGALLLSGNFQLIFAVMAITGALLWPLLYRLVPETLPAEAPRPAWADLRGSYGTLLRSRGFLGYTAVYGFFQGGFFAFLAVGAAVFSDSFGLGPTVFGTVWGFMGASYVFGAFFGGRVSAGARRPLLLPVCVLSSLLFAALIPFFDLLIGPRMLTVLLPMVLMMAATGAATPLVMAGAVYQVPQLAGTAAGLSSAIGMVLGGCFTVLAGTFYRGDFTPVGLLIASAALLTALSWLTIRHR